MNIVHLDEERERRYDALSIVKDKDMRYASLTLGRLKEMLEYEPTTGIFTWKQRPYSNSRKRAGDVAGALKFNGSGAYRYIGIDGRAYLASQLAWFYVHGEWAPGHVGVKNSDPSDIRAANLVALKGPVGDFDHNTREGRSAYRKAMRCQHPDEVRGRQYKRYYGISLDDYQRIFAEQHGVCAICGQPETTTSRWDSHGKARWLSVDHDHETSAVRGLLCHLCNNMLGSAKDNVETLQRAIDYLKSRTASPVLPFAKQETA